MFHERIVSVLSDIKTLIEKTSAVVEALRPSSRRAIGEGKNN
jgi:hypothetical protein